MAACGTLLLGSCTSTFWYCSGERLELPEPVAVPPVAVAEELGKPIRLTHFAVAEETFSCSAIAVYDAEGLIERRRGEYEWRRLIVHGGERHRQRPRRSDRIIDDLRSDAAARARALGCDPVEIGVVIAQGSDRRGALFQSRKRLDGSFARVANRGCGPG